MLKETFAGGEWIANGCQFILVTNVDEERL
jgi:hypothetical protein